MAKLIGRRFNVGFGKETTRGTAVVADYWLPKMDFTFDDKVETVQNESSIGTIHDAEGQNVVGKVSEGQLTGRIADTSFGLLLLATLGSEATPALVATGVYDHVFSVLESAQHPSLTVDVAGANESTGLRYALSMVDSLEITFELQKYGQYSVSFRGNKNASGANTASFTAENIFLPQHGVVKIATNLAGLSGASAIQIKKATIKISKNIQDDQVIGQIDAVDRLNKQFSVDGSLELTYEDRSYIDTIMLGDLQKALRVSFINTDVTIGTASNPTITFDMAKVKLAEVARKIGNNDIITQTVNFNAFYSIADTSMMTATLRNTKSSSY
jgi:hypothetical protein